MIRALPRAWPTALGALLLTLFASLAAAPASAQERLVEVRFAPTKRAQLAVWIERADQTFVRTLGLTQAVAVRGIGNRPGASQMNGGYLWPYGRREGVLPVWAHRRAAAPGAQRFRRVIFQDRYSEGHASRSSSDFSRDDYFCLSFDANASTRDALDAVTCPSPFSSDKGRYLSDADVAAGYYEPAETSAGVFWQRTMDPLSLYPPRRDLVRCESDGCFDHADVATYAIDARAIMPELDAITMATPGEAAMQEIVFDWPAELEEGDYVVFVEVNTEGDYNDRFGPTQFPTPRDRPVTEPDYRDDWDYWAESYGYPYRGQPSVVFSVPFTIGPTAQLVSASAPVGYGSVNGYGPGADEMQRMDGSINDDPSVHPGSGADRLRIQSEGWRVQVTTTVPEMCEGNTAPSAIPSFEALNFPERRHAHDRARLRFVAPADDAGVRRYELRVSTSPITDEDSFLRGIPPYAANEMGEDPVALVVPVSAAAGETVELDIGSLQWETHYYVGLRARDGCNESSPIAVAEVETLPIQFTTVSPCFVATAAYGSPLAEEIGALRRVRDRYLRPTAPGRALIAVYEAVGPTFADWIREDDDARSVVRTLLAPLVQWARALD